MNKKILVISAVVLPLTLGFVVLENNIALAHGWFNGFGIMATPEETATRMQDMFQNEANILGISIDDIKNGWAKGQSLFQIAQDHGITTDQLKQKLQDARLQQIKTQLQVLVDKGIITQAQADSRLQFMQSNNGTAKGGQMMGFRRGLMF